MQLGFSPLAFGALDGLYNGIGALDAPGQRRRRGSLASAEGTGGRAATPCPLSAGWGCWPRAAGGRAWRRRLRIDRLGKGVRTVPRDALIAQSTPPAQLGYAFGVHRALDACGAVLGPVAAFALLAAVPQGFDVVFVASFFAALLGLGVLLLFVENLAPSATGRRRRR